MSSVEQVLADAHRKGVRLWLEHGQLRYRAPKGALRPDDVARLTSMRGQLVRFLERGSDSLESRLTPRSDPTVPAPLSYSQLKYWTWARLHTCTATRTIVSATRLQGRLDETALTASLARIVQRHEALRTEIIVVDGVPLQRVRTESECELREHDFTTVEGHERGAAIERLLHQLILEPIHVTRGPLFEMHLVRLQPQESVLIAVLEHIIADAFSLNVMLRELFAVYFATANGAVAQLPPVPIQIADYGLWQQQTRKDWEERKGHYWAERHASCGRLRIPAGSPTPTEETSSGCVPLRIGPELKRELQEYCRLRRTTLVMGVFTAFVAVVLRWCRADHGVIGYQTDGRISPQVQNTMGYFAAVLNLRMELHAQDTFDTLLSRVTQEYCKAYEHHDLSYVDAQVPRPEFTRNPGFNWIPRGSYDTPVQSDATGALTLTPVPFTYPEIQSYDSDYEPALVLYDRGESIDGGIYFPPQRFAMTAMNRFAQDWLALLTGLLKQPEARVHDVPLAGLASD